MDIFRWPLIIVIIIGFATRWNKVEGGSYSFQQDPSNQDSSSRTDPSPLFIDADAPGFRDAPSAQKSQEQTLKVIKSEETSSNDQNGLIDPLKNSNIPSVPITISTPSPKSSVSISNEPSFPAFPAAITESSDYDLLGVMGDDSEVGQSVVRRRRMYPIFTRHGFMFSENWFFHTTVTPPLMAYGQCVLGRGFEKNKYCLPGEVCINRETLRPPECPLTKPCEACPAPPPPGDPPPETPPNPPEPCTPGCKPGLRCPDPAPDGICVDSTFGTDQYFDMSTSEKEPSPMAYFGGQLLKNESCTAYGDAIDALNRGNEDFNDKSRKLRLEEEASGFFGSGICNWVIARLQCIASEPRVPPTPTPAPGPGSGPPPQPDVALGEKAVAIRNENDTEICYIPANRGYHSTCSHEIFLPYGGIDGVKKDGKPYVKLQMLPAGAFCVPNAECKLGYKYTGLRCMCKRKYVWEPLTSTCANALRLKAETCYNNYVIFFVLIRFLKYSLIAG